MKATKLTYPAVGLLTCLWLSCSAVKTTLAAEASYPPELEIVMAYLLEEGGENFPELFGGAYYRVKVKAAEVADLDGDGITEVMIGVTPHYRQSPTIIIFQMIDDQVHRVNEGLAPGPLQHVSGNYIDSHTVEGSGVDLLIEVSDTTDLDSMRLAQRTELVTQFGAVVEYPRFFHVDIRKGAGVYIDMTKVENPPTHENCESFEFSTLESLEILYDDEFRPILTAIAGGKLTMYQLTIIDGTYLRRDKVVVMDAPPADE